MIIDKEIVCSDSQYSATSVSIEGKSCPLRQYPAAAKKLAECFISAFSELGIQATYDEKTYKMSINKASVYLIYGDDAVGLYMSGTNTLVGCTVNVSNSLEGEIRSATLQVKVIGTSNSFEVFVGIQDFFGSYTFERAHDKKKFTAIRLTSDEGNFVLYNSDSGYEEYGRVIMPHSGYPSAASALGVVLVPAVTTNFAYRILDAFLYIPSLQTGTYYEIADFSVVAVASCVLLAY